MADKYTSKRNQNSADGISPKDPPNSTDEMNFNKNGLIPGKRAPADKRKISTAIQFGGGEFIGITRNLTDLFSPSARNVTPGADPQGSGASADAGSRNYYAEGRASPNPQTQPPGKTFRIKTVGSSGEEGFFDVTKEEDLDNFIKDIHAGKYGDINELKSDTTQPLAARIATMNQDNERRDITGILKRAFKDSNSPEEIASKLNKELDESYNVWTYFKNKKEAVPDYEEFRKDPQKYTDSLSPEEKAELETLILIDEETNEFRKKNIGRQERFAHFKAEDFASIEPEPEPEPDLEPDFEKIETAYADLYRGVGMSNIVGRNGMGTGDSAINDAVLERERQGAAQEEAKLAQNKAQIRAFNNANYGTQIHLQAQKFLDETRYLPQAERREAYDNFIQTLLANESLSPNAPGLSDEERYDRNVTMQNALNQLALNTQQAMQEYDREAFIADKTGQIQSLISLAQDEKNAEQDEVNYRAMMTQIAQLKTVMPPMQYRKIKMDAAVSFTNTVNSREIQEAIKKAAQTQSLVDVNEVMKKVNQNIEEGYFTILADIQDGDKTFGQLFKNNITTASIQHRNALLEYNENLFKQREGQFQVWNNNGFLNRAAEQGKFWRDELEEAINNGSVDRNFYYQSKDFYRPLAVGKSPSGGDTIKGNDKAFADAVGMMDEWFVTNGTSGFSPSGVFEYLKEVIEVPDEYKARFLDGQGRKNKAFEAHIQKRMLDELVKAYMSDGDVKRIQGGSRHIQDILVGLSDVQEYFERLSKPDRDAELKKIGNKDTTLDAKEMRDMAERSTNIVLGAFIEEMKAGCPNISDFETNAKWISDLRNRAVSRYIAYAAQTGGLAEAADKMEGGKVGESGLRDASKLLADWTRSNSDLPDAESYYDPENFIGQPSEKEKMDKAAAERLFKDYMTNISKKVEIEKTLNTDSAGSTASAAYQGVTYYVHEKKKRLNRYTPDYNFEKAELRFDEKNRPYFEVEDQGTRYRYVFAPNKDTVDALVYELTSKDTWEGRETISNIGRKGLR